MGTRRSRAITALGALVCLAAGCRGARPASLGPGDAFPSLDGVPESPLRLVWVVRPDDYLTCRTAAEGVRQLQRRFGAVLPVQIVHVGPHPEWMEAFARRQRIDAAVFTTDERRFRHAFGSDAAPLLYLVAHGLLVDSLPGTGEVVPAERWEHLIQTMLADGGTHRGVRWVTMSSIQRRAP